MKLAVGYTIYNGLELLEKSIESIDQFADVIILCYQTTSNKGIKSGLVEPMMQKFKGKKFHLVKFTPDLSQNTKVNERRKLQLRIDEARKLGCTHFLPMACDHFYLSYEFKAAMEAVEYMNYFVSVTKMFTYFKHPTWGK